MTQDKTATPRPIATTEPPRSAGGMSPLAAAALVGAVLGVSALVGRRNAPDPSHPNIRRWYRSLDKPSYTPPDPVFGAVWPVLEIGLGIGGYRLLRQRPGTPRNVATGLWLFNSIMIGGWSELFFRRRRLAASAAASAAMVGTGTAYMLAAGRVDRTAAATAAPFVGWLCFATLLSERVRERN